MLLRTKRKLVPITRTNYGKQTLSYQIPTVINRFPFETEYYLPQKRFKSIIKKRLLEQTERDIYFVNRLCIHFLPLRCFSLTHLLPTL